MKETTLASCDIVSEESNLYVSTAVQYSVHLYSKFRRQI